MDARVLEPVADLVVLDVVERELGVAHRHAVFLENIEADDRVGGDVADRLGRIALHDRGHGVDVVDVDPVRELLLRRQRGHIHAPELLADRLQRRRIARLQRLVVEALGGVVIRGQESVPLVHVACRALRLCGGGVATGEKDGRGRYGDELFHIVSRTARHVDRFHEQVGGRQSAVGSGPPLARVCGIYCRLPTADCRLGSADHNPEARRNRPIRSMPAVTCSTGAA